MQSLLVLLLPKTYAVLPALSLLGLLTINTILVTKGIRPNPYLSGLLWKKTTAQVFDKNGNFAGPGQEKVAVLLLGAKSNHPLGVLSPDYPKLVNYIKRMSEELEGGPQEETGCK